jgi:uncharacterized membrane protein
MKKFFITGLVILLPVALTLIIVAFIFNLLTNPLLSVVKGLFEYYHLFDKGFLFLSSSQVQNAVAKILILVGLIGFTIILGFIARWFFFNSLLRFADYIVKQIPLVRSIYKTSQDVIKTIFTSDNKSFKQVVLVKFPNADTYAVGLVTRESIPSFTNTSHSDMVAVFVPTTPNPTSGFLIFFKTEDLIYLDMKVEEAFKYVISCGTILPTFQSMPIKREEK